MSAPTPLLDFFRNGGVAREVRLEAAQGLLAPRAHEQAELLLFLLEDPDGDIKQAAEETLQRIPVARVAGYLARSDVDARVLAFFAARGTHPSPTAAGPGENEPLTQAMPEPPEAPPAELVDREESAPREGAAQAIAKMSFPQRLQAAMKGTREIRSLLIRDSNKTISAAVLSSSKLSDSEIEGFARMASLPEETLRIIGSNRRWTKNYKVLVALTRNPKTPLAMSLNLMSRLQDRDLQMLSTDRNVPEPLRVAARKKVLASTSRR